MTTVAWARRSLRDAQSAVQILESGAAGLVRADT